MAFGEVIADPQGVGDGGEGRVHGPMLGKKRWSTTYRLSTSCALQFTSCGTFAQSFQPLDVVLLVDAEVDRPCRIDHAVDFWFCGEDLPLADVRAVAGEAGGRASHRRRQSR